MDKQQGSITRRLLKFCTDLESKVMMFTYVFPGNNLKWDFSGLCDSLIIGYPEAIENLFSKDGFWACLFCKL